MRRTYLSLALGALTLAHAATAQSDADVARAKALVVDDAPQAAAYVRELRRAPKRDDAREFELAFLEGAAAQRSAAEASCAPAEPRCAAWLAQAREAYTQAARLRPTSSAVAYNQATLEASLGNEANAADGLERALELARANGDPKLGLYQLRYAELFGAARPERAARELEARLAEAPGDAHTVALLEPLYLAHAPEKLAALGARALAAGDLDAAERDALALLGASAPAPALRSDALRLLAASWARSGRDLVEPRSQEVTHILLGQADQEVGGRARELLAAMGASAESFPYWQSDSARSANIGRSGRAILRDLLRALAQEWARDPGAHAPDAERALLAAIPLGEHGADPDAFLEATTLFAERGQPERIRSLMERYQYDLFSEKSDAYGRGDWQLVHHMHLALGLTYAALGEWQSQSSFQNAFFQLDAAMRAAERFNTLLPAGASERLATPALAVETLASAYEQRLGKPQEAERVREEGAAALSSAGRQSEANALVRRLQMPIRERARAPLPPQDLRVDPQP